MAQRLRLHAARAGGGGLIPGQGTRPCRLHSIASLLAPLLTVTDGNYPESHVRIRVLSR